MNAKVRQILNLNKLRTILTVNQKVCIALILLVVLLITNTFHEKYPDEFDNIAGGNFINNGIWPYSGFFTHHSPLAYFFSAVLLWFSGVSFVNFRIVLAMFYCIYHLGLFLYVRNKFLLPTGKLMLTWSLYVALISSYMWGHMFLADSFAALLLVPAYIVLFLSLWQKKDVEIGDITLISLLLAGGLLTSITYIFVTALGYLALFYIVLKQQQWKLLDRVFISTILISAVPYLIFMLYLLVTNSYRDFYYQAIFFNREYYVALTDGSRVSNPVRYAVVIFATFIENFRLILIQVKDFNFTTPFAVTFALANTVLIATLALQKRWTNLFLLLGFMVYVNVRSNPLSTGVTDYQSASYHYLSLFNGIFALWLLWQSLQTEKHTARLFIYRALFMLLSIYSLFFTYAMFNSWFDKVYSKYMGYTPLIYDRPELAPTVNTLIKADEYYYIGPFAFEEHLYTRGRLASKYFITIPAMDKAEKVQSELIQELEATKPPLVIFDIEYGIFGALPGRFLLSYLETEYTTLEKLDESRNDITFDEKTFGTYELGSEFFIRKDSINTMLPRFKEANLIK